METFEVLEKARDLIINPKDWCCEGWGWETGRRCAIHAIASVLGHEDEVTEEACHVQIAVENVMRQEELADGWSAYLGYFNDTHSHADVIDLFNRAIRAEKAKSGLFIKTPVAA